MKIRNKSLTLLLAISLIFSLLLSPAVFAAEGNDEEEFTILYYNEEFAELGDLTITSEPISATDEIASLYSDENALQDDYFEIVSMVLVDLDGNEIIETTEEASEEFEENADEDSIVPAALPDLYFDNFNPKFANPPFSLDDLTEFEFTIVNGGPVSTVQMVQVGVYMDENYRGANNIMVLPANTGVRVTARYGFAYFGMHNIRLVADPNNNIAESNKSNNTISRAWQWGTAPRPDLSITEIAAVGTSGKKNYPYQIPYRLSVINVRDGSVSNPEIALYWNGELLATFKHNATYEAFSGYYLNVNAFAITSNGGRGTISFKVDPNELLYDYDRSNNTKSETFEVFSYRAPWWWQRSKSIAVNITESDPDNAAKIREGIGIWNNSGKGITISESSNSSNNIYFIDDINEDWLGLNTAYRNPSSYTYSRTEIKINTAKLAECTHTEEYTIHVILHELGHSLGFVDNPILGGRSSIMTYQTKAYLPPNTGPLSYDKLIIDEWFDRTAPTYVVPSSRIASEDTAVGSISASWIGYESQAELYENSDAVLLVEGSNVVSESVSEIGVPYTYTDAKILTSYKGTFNEGSNVTIKQLGNKYSSPCEDMIYLEDGESYLLFLRAKKDGSYEPLNPLQALYEVDENYQILDKPESAIDLRMDVLGADE